MFQKGDLIVCQTERQSLFYGDADTRGCHVLTTASACVHVAKCNKSNMGKARKKSTGGTSSGPTSPSNNQLEINTKDKVPHSAQPNTQSLKEPSFPKVFPSTAAGGFVRDDIAAKVDSRKTTRQMLVGAISKKVGKFLIPDIARIDHLLWLFKAKVDKDLRLPQKPEFSQRPRVLKEDRLKGETVEELRHALQVYAPHIFVYSIALRPSCLIDLYVKFVIEGNLPPERTPVLGFHYAVIDKEE
ncbi:uncharacterized protein MELLADRAFT_112584 [Melampsora larici-populina 98AG31]|uniref:Uncharacterized protein n=1 Tax=Melampsora larici-populina (strain 98AG31 / pathotype 3-4-7) TaxID=747676 RepID=F4S6Y6_MELLP|nr:uncharacterized protein MELLADRAFT_112584 [Melampsora larici-populina 98AG31]EGF99540.1 hypothetical protein MELLADRAFT_112584 [Melampsora larici-populina 98AG31]